MHPQPSVHLPDAQQESALPQTPTERPEHLLWILSVLERFFSWLAGPFPLEETSVTSSPFFGCFHLPSRQE